MHLNQTNIGKFCNTLVEDLYCHDIMFSVCNGQRLAEVTLVDQVANQESRATSFDGLGQILKGKANIRSRAFWLEIKQLANDIQYMLSSLLGRYKLLDLI